MKLGQRVKRVDSTGELVSKHKQNCLAHFQKIVFCGYQFRNTELQIHNTELQIHIQASKDNKFLTAV